MAEATTERTDLPLGVVIRRTPGVTRWAKWSWSVAAVLPGAAPADWAELRRDGDCIEYHAATLPLTLWPDQTDAYLINLADRVPSIYVILRPAASGPAPLEVSLVTASPFEGQDYADTGEEIVEKVAMTDGLIAWLHAFVRIHHAPEAFVKRRRDRTRTDLHEDGVGDARIRQATDVYRAPPAKGGLQ